MRKLVLENKNKRSGRDTDILCIHDAAANVVYPTNSYSRKAYVMINVCQAEILILP